MCCRSLLIHYLPSALSTEFRASWLEGCLCMGVLCICMRCVCLCACMYCNYHVSIDYHVSIVWQNLCVKRWWYTPLIPGKRQVDFWIRDHLVSIVKFQDSQTTQKDPVSKNKHKQTGLCSCVLGLEASCLGEGQKYTWVLVLWLNILDHFILSLFCESQHFLVSVSLDYDLVVNLGLLVKHSSCFSLSPTFDF